MKRWRKIRIVFEKERLDHFRDKRSLFLSMVFPLLAPLLVGSLLYLVAQSSLSGGEAPPLVAPVTGAEFAPDFVSFLTERGVVLRKAPVVREYQERAVENGELPFVLIIPEEAKGQRSFNLEILTNQGSPASLTQATALLRHVSDYSRMEAERLVAAAGLPTQVLMPVSVTTTKLGKDLDVSYLFYNVIPSLLMFMIFMGAVYLAIDVTVGERDRGSLEVLLATPITRFELLAGKAMAALYFTGIIVLINLAAFYGALHWATSGANTLAPPPNLLVFVKLFVVAVPLMVLAVGLQMTIAFATRSAKEAQIYLGLLPIVPLIPGLIMVFSPVDATPAIAAIPIYGQLALFIDFIEGKGNDVATILSSMAATAVTAGLVFMFASRLFEKERTVIGG
jgi:sodium transport system permease protein